MSAIATSADGKYILMALDDTGTGFPVFVRAARTDLTTWTKVYDPGAGTAANVVAVPGNPDKMIFYGNFGTDVVIIEHTISTDTNTDISPAGLGAKVVNTLEVNPSDEQEMWATVDTDQDLKRTTDGGTTWADLDAALGFDATALDVLWSGAYLLDRGFVAGQVAAANLDLIYSPNEFSSNSNKEDATLGAADDIVSVETTEA